MGIIALRRRPVSVATAFDPATLALTGWWRASYVGAPWAANASAGTSLANGDLTTAGADPTVGAAIGGRTPASFNGTSQYLRNGSAPMTSFFSTGAATIIALFNPASAAAPGLIYTNPPIICNNSGDFGMSFTTSGLHAFGYDGAYKEAVKACSPGSYHIGMFRKTGSVLGVTVDSTSEVTVAFGAMTALSGALSIGRSYGATYYNGSILEIMTSNVALTNANYTDIKTYLNARYALSL